MVCIDQDGDFCAFEKVRPAPETVHDCQEFAVIDGVILFCCGEFLGVKSYWLPWSKFVCTVCSFDWGVALVKDGTCSDLGCVNLKLELP